MLNPPRKPERRRELGCERSKFQAPDSTAGSSSAHARRMRRRWRCRVGFAADDIRDVKPATCAAVIGPRWHRCPASCGDKRRTRASCHRVRDVRHARSGPDADPPRLPLAFEGLVLCDRDVRSAFGPEPPAGGAPTPQHSRRLGFLPRLVLVGNRSQLGPRTLPRRDHRCHHPPSGASSTTATSPCSGSLARRDDESGQ